MREIPVPTPKDDEVLIKVEYTGANYIDNCEYRLGVEVWGGGERGFGRSGAGGGICRVEGDGGWELSVEEGWAA